MSVNMSYCRCENTYRATQEMLDDITNILETGEGLKSNNEVVYFRGFIESVYAFMSVNCLLVDDSGLEAQTLNDICNKICKE